jgi:hypothetical protein
MASMYRCTAGNHHNREEMMNINFTKKNIEDEPPYDSMV